MKFENSQVNEKPVVSEPDSSETTPMKHMGTTKNRPSHSRPGPRRRNRAGLRPDTVPLVDQPETSLPHASSISGSSAGSSDGCVTQFWVNSSLGKIRSLLASALSPWRS